MKKYNKLFLIPIIAMSIVIGNINTVKAEGYYTLKDYYEDYKSYVTSDGTNGSFAGDMENAVIKYVQKGFDSAGFIIDNTGVLYNKIKSILSNQSGSGITNDSTPRDVADFFVNNTSVSGNNVIQDNDINTFVKSYANDYINSNSIRLVYSYDIKQVGNVTNMGAGYSELCSLLQQKQDNYYCVWYNNRIVFFPKENVVCYHHTTNTNTAEFVVYSDNEKTPITWQANDNYVWNGTNWVASQAITGQIGSYVTFEYNTSPSTGMSTSFQYLITYDQIESLLFYPSVNDVGTNDNLSPYYYNREVWQDFSTSSGDYTFTPTNINTVTYGDISDYVDNSYTDNSYYPDMSQINNWIENTNTDNITNNGGGSGGENGGDDSGSGTSGDGIFDFLSDLGGVLGNLIKNLGQAITNIIKGVADLVESIVTDLPTVFFDFIGAIFGWLPDEWVMLLSLSLACMLIWGIVKVIRG